MYILDEVYKIESEEEYDYIPQPRAERKEVKINHTTDVGRIIHENYPTKAGLVYAKANNLLSEMLSKGYFFTAFETKVSSMLRLARETGKPPQYVIGALTRMIKEL